MIDKKFIFKDVEVENYKELFHLIGKNLIDDQIVKEGFVEALLEREENFPTGLPVEHGVAIPHTDGALVNEDKLVFVTLKKPVTFGEMGGGPTDTVDVSVAIFLAIGNGEKHLETLQKLINSIQTEGFVKGLIDSKDKEEMYEVIKKFM